MGKAERIICVRVTRQGCWSDSACTVVGGAAACVRDSSSIGHVGDNRYHTPAVPNPCPAAGSPRIGAACSPHICEVGHLFPARVFCRVHTEQGVGRHLYRDRGDRGSDARALRPKEKPSGVQAVDGPRDNWHTDAFQDIRVAVGVAVCDGVRTRR